MNILCTICSDQVNQAENIYVTKCGHMFHLKCLSQWISRSKTCPQCRNTVTERCMFRIYPTISSDSTGEGQSVENIRSILDDTQLELRQHKADLKTAKENLKKSEDALKEYEKRVKAVEDKLWSKVSAISALVEQINYLKVENKLGKKLKEENDELKQKIRLLSDLRVVVNSMDTEVDAIIKGYSDPNTLALFTVSLRRALIDSEKRKVHYRNSLYEAKKHFAAEVNRNNLLKVKINQLEDKLANTERLLEENKQSNMVLRSSKKKLSPEKRKLTDNEQTTSPRAKRQRKNTEDEVPSTSGALVKTKSPGKTMSPAQTQTEPVSEDDPSETREKLIEAVKNSKSPYLILKHGGMALRSLEKCPAWNKLKQIQQDKVPGFTILPNSTAKENHSIFKNNRDITITIPLKESDSQTDPDVSYDGLGGHSKADVFPKPKPVLKSRVPKVTAKHKLKRPTASRSQDITNMFKKATEK